MKIELGKIRKIRGKPALEREISSTKSATNGHFRGISRFKGEQKAKMFQNWHILGFQG